LPDCEQRTGRVKKPDTGSKKLTADEPRKFDLTFS
jgi:hypothetical protein